RPWEGKFSIIGNFPYNISSQILLRVLEWKDQVDRVVGMFQKEVAARVVAPPGTKTYGILSVLVQAFFNAEYLFDVPPESFNPPPRVMSGVIRLTRNDNPFGVENMEQFTRLVKTSFGQRRKILRNPARALFDPGILEEEIFARRPEQLTIRQFADLSKRMKQYG
ncbi:MAG TPA: rRNA adenine dimethyltransferase family protein, partial [Chitinophagaceae bacterium]|nr:rRNA adenine dimethyltransferase family protein [Chitinophagaceae bacterium]